LRDRYGEFTERGAELIAIAPDTLENAQRYFQSNDIPFPCLPDPNRGVFRQYDVKSAMISLGQRPGLFVIDRAGVVRYAYLGWQQWEIPTVDETLRQLDAL
jgi:peroxiredoxin Q/BCP